MKRHFFAFFFVALLALAALACNVFTASTPAPGGIDGRVVTQVAVLETATPDLATVAVDQPPTETPEPTPTRGPLPTPTRDPNLPEWTIMVFLNADNNLELPGLYDIVEMEAAGSSDQVNVLVQVDRIDGYTSAFGDWTTTRRYRIVGDDDYSRIASPVLEELGEVNMGDADELADFLIWGITQYPANRYALVLWNHGAGWIGISFDDSSPYDNHFLTMQDLAYALDRALTTTGVPKLDIVGFDACLMGQLEVYSAIQPYAHYAVGSEELVPGLGWDYETLLRNLYADPQMETTQLVQHMVDDFIAFYTNVDPDDFVTKSAVDLNRLPLLTEALEELALALSAEPSYTSSAVGDARTGAEAFALIYPEDADHYAAIDLWHFAAILSQRSSDEAVTAAARQVMAAVDDVVVAAANGAGFRYARGVAIYFPRTSEFLDDGYTSQTALGPWDGFLKTYHSTGLAAIQRPEFHIANVLSTIAGVQKPAYMDVEIIGRDIESVVLINGRYEADGRLRLTQYDNLVPEPSYLPDGSQLYVWRDGVHQDFFVWETEATYLHDGRNGDFVVMWPTSYESPLYTVEGTFRRAGATAFVQANLVFDTGTGQLNRVWGFQSEKKSAPHEIFPEPGDEFQIFNLYLNGAGDMVYEAGVRLTFDSERQLAYDWRPLPSGDYFLGFSARSISGETADTFTDLTVDNDNLLPGYVAYLDPYQGFQFLYPAGWYKPGYDGTQLYTGDLAGQSWLYVTLYPEGGRATAADLKQQTLEVFGGVDVLYEENVTLAGVPGLLIAYGYEGSEGAQTGFFIAFVRDGAGFVVDLDGPLSAEEENLQIMRTLIASWQFQPVGFGLQPGNWATLELDEFSISVPTDFSYEELENGWQLFSATDYVTFVALRSDPASGDDRPALARSWAEVAGDEVRDFNAGEVYRFALANSSWARVDFSYTNDDGQAIRGFIIATIAGGQDVVAWAEAPAAQFEHLEESVFLVAVSDMMLRP
jgi:hypothetical protein